MPNVSPECRTSRVSRASPPASTLRCREFLESLRACEQRVENPTPQVAGRQQILRSLRCLPATSVAILTPSPDSSLRNASSGNQTAGQPASRFNPCTLRFRLLYRPLSLAVDHDFVFASCDVSRGKCPSQRSPDFSPVLDADRNHLLQLLLREEIAARWF